MGNIVFARFEHLAYQQWCILHEGFRVRNVTDIAGEASWGSYMEDPPPGSRLGKLQPLWISAKAFVGVEKDILAPLSQEAPPLLVFDADKEASRFGDEALQKRWQRLLSSLLGIRTSR